LISLYSHLFKEDFHAHNAIEDVKALIKILFKSSLEITTKQVIEHGRVATAKQAYNDMVFLYECVIWMDEVLFQMPLSKSSLSRESFMKLPIWEGWTICHYLFTDGHRI
jgi:hypothetical protein